MAGLSRALLRDLPDEVGQLLATAPITEKKLLEQSIAWRDLSPVQARMAEALRVFVITWDPLEQLPGRPALALGEEPEMAGQLPDWLVNLVLDLGRAGLGVEAVRVGEALAQVDPGDRAI